MQVSYFKYFAILFSIVMLSSCYDREPRFEYKYNDKPAYSWGYAEFYGDFYNYADIDRNVLTLSLFSDSLYVNDEGSLAGHGQYLFVEDIFIPATDSVLPAGTYKADTTAAPMTFYPGELFEVDENKYPVGAYLYYIEKRQAFSTVKYISRGSFTLSRSSDMFFIQCDFVMSDSSVVKGNFQGKLPHFDNSEPTADKVRKRLKLFTEIKFQ